MRELLIGLIGFAAAFGALALGAVVSDLIDHPGMMDDRERCFRIRMAYAVYAIVAIGLIAVMLLVG
ncbi:hypothetical protein SCX11_10700 [Bifidobacterium longum]|uniref:Uncharacterized protein n=1 Tax=Bifidobacterium longum TaxID=216816 RepID=A0AAW9CLP5_BIFLN|nr:hypothetical protein [Bifidobacterium longum]MDW7547188.1 hypothetical protein [Bifidobacterium longum]MDW7582747.1 hypothetical protein [Bifidobacterium longum]